MKVMQLTESQQSRDDRRKRRRIAERPGFGFYKMPSDEKTNVQQILNSRCLQSQMVTQKAQYCCAAMNNLNCNERKKQNF